MAIAEVDGSSEGQADDLTVRHVLDRGGLRSVFQPIVDLVTTEVIAYEALARGPSGSALESPAALFAAAAGEGLVSELDQACRELAVEGARAAGMHRSVALFVNAEPGSPSPSASGLAPVDGREGPDVVTEITERAITRAPAELLSQVRRLRAGGDRLAVDDVGVDARSLGLLPFIAPEVVKLDRRVVQTQDLTRTARVATAVRAYAEDTGALVIAEGIETPEHRDTALALGADYGQGWLFGWPGALPPAVRMAVRAPLRFPAVAEARSHGHGTPFERLSSYRAPRRGTKALLLRMSRAIERQIAAEGEAAVIISTFQDAAFFTPATRRLYVEMARRAAFVGALGVGLPPLPAPGIRGASLQDAEPLRREWNVCGVGPYLAGAFAARDLGDDGPDDCRRFDFVMTHDRELVLELTGDLLRRIAPA